MAESSHEAAVVNARIVYWGIEGSGKSTNLQAIYAKLRPDHRGEMCEVPTRFDPTISYEELPIELGEIAGVRTQIRLMSVPAGPEQAPSRKQLLDEIDGIVLVVDSQRERSDENIACCEELRTFLADYGRDLADVPLVVQYNKRDLADPYALEELHRKLDLRGAAVFEAVATEQSGVLQTLSTISKRVIRTLRERDEEKPDSVAAESPSAEVLRPQPQPPAAERPVEAPPPPAAASPDERMEEAILREGMHPEAEAIEKTVERAQTLLDAPWEQLSGEVARTEGVRIGADLSIVSVGEATRSGERAVRVPLVLGDGQGGTCTLTLTIQLDPEMDEN